MVRDSTSINGVPLKSGLEHSKSLKMVPVDRSHIRVPNVSLAFHSNCVKVKVKVNVDVYSASSQSPLHYRFV